MVFMNRILLVIVLFLNVGVLQASEVELPTIWLEDDSVLKCSPREIQKGQALSVTLGENHGRELSIYRESENLHLFLVVGSPPINMNSLMTPNEFEQVRELIIQPSTTGFRWDVAGGNEAVFSKTGDYTVYVSENLESEYGGYICRVSVVNH